MNQLPKLFNSRSYVSVNQPTASCAETVCNPFEITAEDLEVIKELRLRVGDVIGISIAASIGSSLVFFAVAGVIFWRKSDDWMGLLVSFILIFFGAVLFTPSYDALWRTYAGLRLPLAIVSTLGTSSLLLLLFYFPNGQLVPRGPRARIAVLLTLMTTLFAPTAPRDARLGPGSFLVAGFVILGVAAQIYRYRFVSGPTQRQQTKWVVFGLVVTILFMLSWGITGTIFPPDQPGPARVYFLLSVLPVLVLLITTLPLTMAFSILRYRLWDIDVIIRRTLVYSALTGLLALIYFGVVVVLQAGVGALTGVGDSPLVTVLSTLAIAALFTPLRRRVQNFIDRRFFRAKYDAEQTLTNFATTARDEVDMERLADALVAVVEETMQPESVSVWLTKGEFKL